MIDSLGRLKQILKKNKLDAALISSISNITYLTNFSGFSKEEREAYLFVAKNSQYILTDRRYSEAVKRLITAFELIEISSKNSVKEILEKLKSKHKIKKIGFEGHNITFLEHKKLLQRFDDSNHRSLESLRIIKSSNEISKIKKACELGDKTLDYILKKIKLGVTEKQIAFEIEFFIKKQGADIAFSPIVAFGKNSAFPHHQTTDQRLTTKDKFVLLDFGVKLNNYCSDMTRTVFFGQPTSEQKKMYETVLEAQKLAIEQLNNETIASQIDKVARDYITSKGYKIIPHNVGHGIGIDVHEAPRLSPKSKNTLKSGMVFTIEPGTYIPNFGGVRTEDVVVLEKSGPRLLTGSPRKLTIL